jgi:hypothetical protein
MSFKSVAKAVTISAVVLFSLAVVSGEVLAEGSIIELTRRAEKTRAEAAKLRAEARETEKDAEKYEKTMNVNTFSVAELNLYRAEAHSCRAEFARLIALAQKKDEAEQADRNHINVLVVCSEDNDRHRDGLPENIDAQLKVQTDGDENNAKLRNRHAKERVLLENAANKKNNDWDKAITARDAREAFGAFVGF